MGSYYWNLQYKTLTTSLNFRSLHLISISSTKIGSFYVFLCIKYTHLAHMQDVKDAACRTWLENF